MPVSAQDADFMHNILGQITSRTEAMVSALSIIVQPRKKHTTLRRTQVAESLKP